VKILVTGGAGFIGKHLVNNLLKNGKKVSILDNFSNSDRKSTLLLKNKGVKIFEGDITNFDDVLKATKDQDIVIHLAAKISVSESIKNPLETFRINVEGTKNILVNCKKNNVRKLIIASSAAIYDDVSKKIKITENGTINPISPYGESKIKMEKEIEKICSENKISYVILRFFNIYGIGQTSEYAGVITKFLEKIKKNQSLIINGDGTQIRDFVSINDVVCSINKSIEYNKNGIFNIASGNGVTINQLSKLMILVSGKKLDIQNVSTKQGEIKCSQANILLAKEKLGYIPEVNLKEGIEKLLINVNIKEKFEDSLIYEDL
jgi:UDP-glucose 4-epimerase